MWVYRVMRKANLAIWTLMWEQKRNILKRIQAPKYWDVMEPEIVGCSVSPQRRPIGGEITVEDIVIEFEDRWDHWESPVAVFFFVTTFFSIRFTEICKRGPATSDDINGPSNRLENICNNASGRTSIVDDQTFSSNQRLQEWPVTELSCNRVSAWQISW
jgi:hypothetical protein